MYIVLILISTILILTTLVLLQSRTSNKDKNDVVKQLRKSILVPEETPIIYSIDRPELIKQNSETFKNIQKGDLLIVFKSNKETILYRPKERKVVAVVFLKEKSIENQSTQTATSTIGTMLVSTSTKKSIGTSTASTTRKR